MKKNKREPFWYDEDKAFWVSTAISAIALTLSIVSLSIVQQFFKFLKIRSAKNTLPLLNQPVLWFFFSFHKNTSYYVMR